MLEMRDCTDHTSMENVDGQMDGRADRRTVAEGQWIKLLSYNVLPN